MDIIFDDQAFTRYKRGGIANYFAQLVTNVDAQYWNAILPFKFSLNEHCNDLGTSKLYHMPNFPGRGRVARSLNRLILTPSARKYDVWHSTHYDQEYLKHYSPGNMVMTIHDMIPEIFPELFVTNPHHEKMSYASVANQIIAVSECTKRDACRIYGLDASRVHVVHHGINLDSNDYGQIGLPDQFIIFIGGRGGYKNFRIILDSMPKISEKFPAIKLLCVGGQAFSPDELAEINTKGLGNVFQLGASDSELRYALKRAAAFIYPSLYEGFGIPIVEAMAQNCPLILAQASCFPEIAQDSAVFFDPMSSHSLFEAVMTVLKDTHLRREHIRRASLLVKDYSLSRMLAGTKRVYELARG